MEHNPFIIIIYVPNVRAPHMGAPGLGGVSRWQPVIPKKRTKMESSFGELVDHKGRR